MWIIKLYPGNFVINCNQTIVNMPSPPEQRNVMNNDVIRKFVYGNSRFPPLRLRLYWPLHAPLPRARPRGVYPPPPAARAPLAALFASRPQGVIGRAPTARGVGRGRDPRGGPGAKRAGERGEGMGWETTAGKEAKARAGEKAKTRVG